MWKDKMKNRPSEELLKLLAPEPTAIFNRLRPLITDRILTVIAGADYGNETEVHLKELKPIRDTGAVPVPIHWHPKEVLELIRWLTPKNETPRWKTGLSERENHLIRAFSCAALLRIAAEPGNDGYFEGENQTIAPLVQSAFFLGEEMTRDALSLLAWLMERDRDLYEDGPFLGLGCLLLAARTGAPVSAVRELAAWTVEEEARLRSTKIGSKFGPWLLGLGMHNLKNRLWRELLKPGGDELQPAVEAVLADLWRRVDAPWEDHFVPGELLARAVRVGPACLWSLPDAIGVAERLGGEVFDLKALVFFSPNGAEWHETLRENIKRELCKAVSSSEIRAHYQGQAKRICSILQERMGAFPETRVVFELS